MLEKTPSVAMRSCVVPHVARPVGLAHHERDAASDDALARRLEPADDDRPHDDLIALGHVEAHAGARVVEPTARACT